MSKLYHYYVEGDCEKKLINELKIPPNNFLIPGKVTVLNFINKRISDHRIACIPNKTVIILVYDIDVATTSILDENISKLKNMVLRILSIYSR